MTPKEAFSDPETYATVLLALALDCFAEDDLDDPQDGCLYWAPETWRREIADEFGAKIPEANLSKLMVGACLRISDEFYRSVPTFIEFCNVLAGDDHDPRVFDPADAAECAWGLTEAIMIAPPENPDDLLSLPVRLYIGHAVREDGILNPPDVLKLGICNRPIPVIRDPELREQVWQRSKQQAEAINELIREQLTELVNQLVSLPFRHTDTSDLKARLAKGLTGMKR